MVIAIRAFSAYSQCKKKLSLHQFVFERAIANTCGQLISLKIAKPNERKKIETKNHENRNA